MLPTLVGLGRVLGLRLDVVPAYLQRFLALDEFEVRALLAAASEGWRHMTPGAQAEGFAESALRKLGRLGAQSGGDEVDVDR